MANPPVRLGYGEKAHRTTAVFTWDFAVDGGAIGTLVLGPDTIPVGWYVTRINAFVETALTSAGAATVALGAVANGDLVAAAAFTDYALDTSVNRYPAVSPKQVTAAGLRFTIAAFALTAGKVSFVVELDKRAA